MHEGRGEGPAAAAQQALKKLEERGLDPAGHLSFAEAVEEELRIYKAAE